MKTAQIILAMGLFFLSLSYKAQEKYDFMTIAYDASYREMVISVDGKKSMVVEVDLEKSERGLLNSTPMLQKVKKFQEQDWEVVTFNTTGFTVGSATRLVYITYLRKKKNKCFLPATLITSGIV